MLKHYIKLVVGIVWRFGWNFRCYYCGKLKPLQKITGNHHPCEAEYDRFVEEMEAQREAEDAQASEDYLHMQAILDGFCDHYGCWGELGYCDTHDLCADCGQFIGDCQGRCEIDEQHGYYQDEYDEPELCPCGHPEGSILCVCAEMESFARHNADPATRGSWWVA